MKKLCTIAAIGILFSAPALADWDVAGTVKTVNANSITLETYGFGTMTIQHLPYTQVKIKGYSQYGKHKYYAPVSAIQPGDFAKEVEIIPGPNGVYYAKEIEILRQGVPPNMPQGIPPHLQ